MIFVDFQAEATSEKQALGVYLDGRVASLDRASRSADAIAASNLELYSLSRADFDQDASHHPRMANLIATRLAHALAERLRQTNTELRALEEA